MCDSFCIDDGDSAREWVSPSQSEQQPGPSNDITFILIFFEMGSLVAQVYLKFVLLSMTLNF